MKSAIGLFIVCVLFFRDADAQSSSYIDTPFGGGGGYMPGWIVPSVDELNLELRKLNIPALSENGMFYSGGGGFIYLGFLENFRIGGVGMGGSTSEKAYSNGLYREVEYSLTLGGVTIEYTFPFIKNIAVSIGTVLGGGEIQIDAYQNKGILSWQDIWRRFDDKSISSNEFSYRLKNSFFLISPMLNVDIPFYRFFSFRIGAGYLFAFGDEWKFDNNKELINIPSGLNSNSFYIQSGIYVGIFSF